MSRRLLHLVRQLAIAIIIAAAAAVLPLPVWTPHWILYFHVPAVVFLLVCYTGKLLIDTFFYERYP